MIGTVIGYEPKYALSLNTIKGHSFSTLIGSSGGGYVNFKIYSAHFEMQFVLWCQGTHRHVYHFVGAKKT